MNLREHWSVRAKRARSQRLAAYLACRAYAGNSLCPLTHEAVVMITRVSPRPLDDDNLAASQKHVRDGIADALGIDDRDAIATWRYAQRSGGKGVYAVEVSIERVGVS